MVQAFNIPTPVNYLGNAMQINRQEDQRQTQNALMQRDQQIQEQQFQGQQQDRQTAQAAAQRKLQADVRLAALRTLQNVPEAQRRQVFESQFHADPDWVQAAGEGFSQSVLSNPLALTDGYIGMGINKLGELTQQQELDMAREQAAAKYHAPLQRVLTNGPNGPVVRMIPGDSQEFQAGVPAAAPPKAPSVAAPRTVAPRAAVAPRAPAAPRVAAPKPQADGLTAAARTAIRNNMKTLAILKTQLANVRTAWARIKDSAVAGPLQGYAPTPDGQRFDRAVSQLAPFFRQISRTPGEGAMSDFETKLQQAALPSRKDYEATTEDSIANIEALVQALESQYSGGSAPDGGQVIDYVRGPDGKLRPK